MNFRHLFIPKKTRRKRQEVSVYDKRLYEI